MSTYPRSPHTLKAGLVQAVTGDTGDRTEPLRLKGPPVETFKLEAEIDATDQLECPTNNKDAVEVGIFPQLAVLESLITPASDQIMAMESFLQAGAVEIAAAEAPLTVFVWSSQRIVPVRVTEFSITEEAFDINLNPIRAKVSLGLRVLSVNDFSIADRGTSLYIGYLKNQEALAARVPSGSRDQIGLKGL
jgi:hypothetical protein